MGTGMVKEGPTLWAPGSGSVRTKRRNQGPPEERALANVKRGDIWDMGAPEYRPVTPGSVVGPAEVDVSPRPEG